MSKARKNLQPSLPDQEAKKIKEEAAKFGHKLGKWKWSNGFWYSCCQNKGCNLKITVNRHGHSHSNVHKTRCPIRVNPVKGEKK